jgi:hypothetical protein
MKKLSTDTRTEQQALRAIYDNRALAVCRAFHHLHSATVGRLCAMDATAPELKPFHVVYARERLRMARTMRLSSTMGARLP